MNTLQRHYSSTLRAGLLGMMLAAAGPAMAATYNVILKTTSGAIQTCASGGFTFTKTTIGTFPTTSPSVILNGSTATPCFGVNQPNETLGLGNPGNPGALNVAVADVTLNGQNQGPNVVSVSGNLTSGNGNNNYTINFLANHTFTVNENTGQNPQVGSGTYYVFNTANAAPEPQTLWLVLGSLSALLMSRRLRRRAK
jgi:hypothetical protein